MTCLKARLYMHLHRRVIWILVIVLATFIFGFPLATSRLGNTLDEGFVLSTAYRYAYGDLPIRDEVSGAFTLVGLWFSLFLRVFSGFSLLHFNLVGIALLALTAIAVYLQLSKYLSPFWCGIGALCALPFFTPFHTVFPFYHLTGACAAAWFIYLYSETLETSALPKLYGLSLLAGLVLLIAVTIKPPLIFLLLFSVLSWWKYPNTRIWTKIGGLSTFTLLLPLMVGAALWLVFVQSIGGLSVWAEAARSSVAFESTYDYSASTVLFRPLWEILTTGTGGLVVIGLFVVGWLLLHLYPKLRPWWVIVVMGATGVWLFNLGREFMLYVVGVRTTPLTRYWGHSDVVNLGVWLAVLGTVLYDRNSNVRGEVPLWQTVLFPWALYLYVTQMGSSGWQSLPIMATAPLLVLGIAVGPTLVKGLLQFSPSANDWQKDYVRLFSWSIIGSVLLFGIVSQWAPAFGMGPPGKPRFVSDVPVLAGIRYSDQSSLQRLTSLVKTVEAQTRAADHILMYYRMTEIYFLSRRLPAANAILFYRQHSEQSEQSKIDYIVRMGRLPTLVLRRSDDPLQTSQRPLDMFVRERYTYLETIEGIEVYKRIR